MMIMDDWIINDDDWMMTGLWMDDGRMVGLTDDDNDNDVNFKT